MSDPPIKKNIPLINFSLLRRRPGDQLGSVLDFWLWPGQRGKLRLYQFYGIFTQNRKVLTIIRLGIFISLNLHWRWAAGQPDNVNGNENCLALDLSAQSYAFKDENCDSNQRYICVAMDTTRSSTGGRQAQRECALAFGVDEGKRPINLINSCSFWFNWLKR